MITKAIVMADVPSRDQNMVPLLVQLACQFKSNIVLHHENRKINAKSMLGVMALTLSPGMAVNLLVEGPDEETAATALEDFFNRSVN